MPAPKHPVFKIFKLIDTEYGENHKCGNDIENIFKKYVVNNQANKKYSCGSLRCLYSVIWLVIELLVNKSI